MLTAEAYEEYRRRMPFEVKVSFIPKVDVHGYDTQIDWCIDYVEENGPHDWASYTRATGNKMKADKKTMTYSKFYAFADVEMAVQFKLVFG